MAEVKLTIDKIQYYIKYFDNIENFIKSKQENEINEVYEKNNPVMEGLFNKKPVDYSLDEFINKFIDPMNTPSIELTWDIRNIYSRNSDIENILNKMKITFGNMISTNTTSVTLSDTEFNILCMLITSKQ